MTTSFGAVRKLSSRISPLLLSNAYDAGFPFIRMLVLSHYLDLRELGFASILMAVYGTFQLVTDINISRFVISAPRENYQEALAAAHALSVVRGLVVGAAAVALAPLIADAFSLGAQWPSFAAVGLIVVVGGFEHLAPRIAERDYRYGPQLKVSTVAYGVGLAAMIGSMLISPNHLALVASLMGQMLGLAVGSRLFAGAPYRWRFRTPLFMKAFRFGYPLMFNGLGLAVSAQADRFLVGGMLGLPTLGVYSVLMLVTTVPSTVIVRIVSSMALAVLINSAGESRQFRARLRLMASAVPLLAGAAGLGVLTLVKIVTPLVFGRNFSASQTMVVLLAFGVLFRLSRFDPGTALLLYEGRTKRLALANLSVGFGLAASAALMALAPEIEAATLGRGLGELAGLIVMLHLTRVMLKPAMFDNLLAIGFSSAVLAVGAAFIFATPVGSRIIPSLAFLSLGLAVLAIWALRSWPLLREAGFSSLPGVARRPQPQQQID